ncbi:MAG: sodium:calcium antiporter [Acidimicrobiales bacterium]
MTHSTTTDLAIFVVAAAFALVTSAVLVARLERLAAALRLPEAALGLIVALAADSPEITSAITASAGGQKSVGLGVVFGSNVFNLAALLGLGALIAGRVDFHPRVVLLEGIPALWVAAIAVICVTSGAGAPLGLGLILAVVVPYVVVSTVPTRLLRGVGLPTGAQRWLRSAVLEEEAELADAGIERHASFADAALALLCLCVVVVASAFMERSASDLGKHAHLSSLLVGGVILAGVTSLPNAVGAVYLSLRRRGAAVLSEAMNSNMINVLVGLFLPGIFVGLAAASSSAVLVGTWYSALTLVCLLAAYACRGLGRKQGLAIVAAYGAFVALVIR